MNSTNGTGIDADIRNAADPNGAHRANIINCSFKTVTILPDGRTQSYDYPSVRQAVEDALTWGRLVVASAGNPPGSNDADRVPFTIWPAAYAGVLAVSATNSSDQFPSGYNYGSHVDISGPAVDILTLDVNNGYRRVDGTSFSAPLTAALAGLIRSVNTTLTGSQIADVIMASADDLGPTGWDERFGHGRINAYRAVKEALPKLINYTFTSNTTLGYTRLMESATLASNVVVTVQAGQTVVMEGLLQGGTNSEVRVYGTFILETAAYVNNVKINVESGGRLVSRGTPTGRITLTSTSGTWQGITFNGAASSNLTYCDILYATMPIKATNTSNLTVSNVTIGNSSFYNGSDNAAMAFYNSFLPSVM